MKSLTLPLLAIAGIANAAVLAEPDLKPVNMNMPLWNFANESTPDAKADGSVGVLIEPDLVEGKGGKDGATVTKIKFGPYTVSSGQTLTKNLVGGLNGASVPCRGCYVVAMQHGMEYADGKTANVDTGAWLHHTEMSVTSQKDYVCPNSFLINFGGNRIFAGGNERIPIRMNSHGKYGLDLGAGALGGQVEIMSESTKPLTVYLTMLFEWLPKTTPGYKPAVHVWMDVTNCMPSDFPAQTGSYNKKSAEVAVKHDGELLFVYGHAHDGATKIELLTNGKVACTSKQIYANRRGGYVESTDTAFVIKEMQMPAGTHISDTGVCKGDFGRVRKGDKLQSIAYYDEAAHMQMRDKRKRLEMQMGIAQTYIGLDWAKEGDSAPA
ncbi:hypothetical protein EG328_002901 [Venturia inaequalis]|uniref:Uncharacterized protein n=1 Tax=Venturia inaequalis TaxID=5025 RepID=A0A8H3UUH6_VENIN|nr:hypothetical protein EG328_002901 [Venturia inaequalis]KAE9990267.1 hypothetical protein EG327_001650 [Venturia inaequalis]RDI77948.1 hypothetical protein Vi05172_g12056 [Venturia inaequalis]